jgi:hypothetical protein
MKHRFHFTSVIGCSLVLIIGGVVTHAQDNAAILGVERASQLAGPWEQVPVNQIPMTADGKFVDPASLSAGFYRLTIRREDVAGAPVGLPLAGVPKAIVGYAQEHLDSLAVDEADWEGAALGPLVVPVYHPAVNGGKLPAFYEFKVVAQAGRPSSPVDPRPERGFILVSSGVHSFPIGEYATQGPTPSERLRFLAKSTAAHIVRYTSSYWVAEDANGGLMASLGSTPYRMPDGILESIGKEPTTEIVEGKVIQQGMRPELQPKPYGSYSEFKEDVVNGPVHSLLRYFTSQRALVDWNLRREQSPEIINVPLKETVLVLNTLEIASADLEDPIANITPSAKTGLLVTGTEQGASLLMVMSPEKKCQFYVLAVGVTNGGFHLKGWSSWSSSYAGSCSDIPAYDQEWDLSGCCSDGWSGCGPTAWAMFYGYWDNKGVSNLIGGTGGTPWSNNDHVRVCIRNVFDYCDTWCAGEAAATNPWDMTDGYLWTGTRGEGISLSSSWTVPYTSSGPRNRAKSSIVDHGWPAIVGTGYFEHYPFAYGYRHRKYTWLGITWSTDRNWKVNNGWGSGSCSWVNANDCWYGTRGYCY